MFRIGTLPGGRSQNRILASLMGSFQNFRVPRLFLWESSDPGSEFAVSSHCPEGLFFPGTSVFPSPEKATFLNNVSLSSIEDPDEKQLKLL